MKREYVGVGGVGMKKKEEGEGERRGPWTPDEDELLIRFVRTHGEGRWNLLAKSSGLKRTGKSCRLRWLNYLKPDIKRGGLTPQEQLLILDLHSKLGNKWSKIAAHLPGRTDNEIKNYWRTRVQKQARQLNMDSNSPSFIDAIRCFYMPRLVQKIEQNSTNSTSLNSEGSSTSPSSQNTHLINSPTMLASDINKDTSFSIMSPSNRSFSETTLQQTTTTTTTSQAGSSLEAGDCYYVNGSNYDDMDLGSISATNNSFSDDHAAGHDWLWDGMAIDGIWGLDELWQYRK